MTKKITTYGAITVPSQIPSCSAPEVVFGVCRGSPWLLSVYCMLYISYLMFGALVFSTVETPGETQLRHRMLELRNAFLTQYPCVQDAALEDLIREVVRASNRGVSAERNVTGEPNWSFGQSLFFASTVVTTIGYGHVTPLSRGGKIFCMVYALAGIPLTLVLLTALVDRLLGPVSWMLGWMNSRLGHLYQPFTVRVFHLTLVVSVLGGLFLLIPAALFAYLEPNWDYLDSFYYCFVSLTTIGLGDYIPGDSPDQPYRPLYKVLTTVYLFSGVTFMMLTLTVFYDIPQLNLGALLATDDAAPEEKVRLAGPPIVGESYNYGLQHERNVVKVRARQRDDSPSPEDTTPVHARLP